MTQRARPFDPIDATLVLCIGTWTIVVFMSAGFDFSYDHANYITSFDRLAEYPAADVWASLESLLPFPYVWIPPAGFFEIGFAFPVWLLMASGLSSTVTYALIGCTSILARLLILRALGMRWGWNLLLAMYSITLFEANAIRLGCALTLSAAGLWALLRPRFTLAIGLLSGACLFHLQAVAFALPLVLALAGHHFISRSAVARAIALALVIALSVGMTMVIGSVEFGKVGDYAGQTSDATGVNAVSLLGLIALVAGAIPYVRMSDAESDENIQRVWASVYLATWPALAMLLLATNMGAIGDRLWQFAFSVLFGVSLLDSSTERGDSQQIGYTVYQWALGFCLFVSLINVLWRYPLSNFFVPFLPYTPIVPLGLIV